MATSSVDNVWSSTDFLGKSKFPTVRDEMTPSSIHVVLRPSKFPGRSNVSDDLTLRCASYDPVIFGTSSQTMENICSSLSEHSRIARDSTINNSTEVASLQFK